MLLNERCMPPDATVQLPWQDLRDAKSAYSLSLLSACSRQGCKYMQTLIRCACAAYRHLAHIAITNCGCHPNIQTFNTACASACCIHACSILVNCRKLAAACDCDTVPSLQLATCSLNTLSVRADNMVCFCCCYVRPELAHGLRQACVQDKQNNTNTEAREFVDANGACETQTQKLAP